MKGGYMKYCIFCNKKYIMYGKSFEQHFRVHTNERPYNCKNCDKSFKSKGNLTSHKKVHGSPNKTVRFVTKCEVCDKPMTCWSQLTLHMRTHTGKKPYKCEQCPIKFATLGNLKTHTNCLHGDIKSYKCQSCPKTFATAHYLKVHIARCHTERKRQKWKYSICDKTFKYKHGLKRHLKSHVDKSRPFECNFCDMKFRTSDERNRHIFVHTKDNRKQCIFCEKQCINMEYHLRTHTQEKPFSCHLCSSSFPDFSHLTRHHSIHKNEKKFQCDICQKRFARRIYLKKHSSVHFSVKPFKCEVCNKRFGTSDTLKMHIWTHTGEKPYKCQDCQKDFRNSTLLKKHRLRHHFEVASKEYNVIDILNNFICVFCQRVCLDKHEFLNHIIGHIKEKAYACVVCDVEYNCKYSLQKHMRTKHKNVKSSNKTITRK